MANYKQMAARARQSAAAAKADAAQMGGLLGGAALIGLMVKSGAMERLPDLGVPKTVIVAGVGKAIGYNSSGTFGRIADGAGNAGAVIALYQWFTSGQVSGVAGHAGVAGGHSLDRERALAARLARQLPARGADGGELAAQVADLEALAEALPDAAE